MLRHFLVVAVLLGAALAACTASTELGMPCTPVKGLPDGGTKLPDGGTPVVVIGDLSAGKDFVSFGVAECEDLVCVVDQQSASEQLALAQNDGGVSLDDPAVGYCSKACVQGNDSTCTPQFDDLQQQPGMAMTCRELVLDPQLIADICKDPVACEKYFGSNRSSFFCARGAPTDGGI